MFVWQQCYMKILNAAHCSSNQTKTKTYIEHSHDHLQQCLPSPSQVHQPAPHAKPSQKPPRPTHWQTWPGCSENPERIISPDFSHVNCATLWILTHMWYCYYLMFAVDRKESPLALPDEAEVCCSPSQQQKWTNWMNCNWFAVNSHVPKVTSVLGNLTSWFQFNY